MRPQVLTETVLTFAEAAASCPAVSGKKPTRETVLSWVEVGVRVNSDRVKLESARVGVRRVTSREALDRFFAAIAGETVRPAVELTPSENRKDSDRKVSKLLTDFANTR
ncbi:hypothetical protein VT84_37495 [Gemmata sp. SH-PL17]|uniref:DUF1580 domain-containing protein n=1 Tax=Gemmata sp. SH-PL17 TaxID=1630693 RepID=UPI00078D14BE|nr:DUF1580 domain-containing protein [Gemmata sp. SH-PL17]AMV30148.1 hypothetical protein VT84_37495 [Gemmata sp. SH-PL17]